MNDFSVFSSGIIAKEKDYNSIKKLSSAKIIVISDIHGYTSALEKILLNFGESSQTLIIAGDSGTDIEDLSIFCQADKVLAKSVPPVIASVCGNCDKGNYNLASSNEILTLPSELNLTIANFSFHIRHIKNFFGFQLNKPVNNSLQILNHIEIHGHTHRRELQLIELSNNDENKFKIENLSVQDKKIAKGNFFILNPGSPSKPRDENPASFSIITINEGQAQIQFYSL